MPRSQALPPLTTLVAIVALGGLVAAAASTLGGAIPGPMPLFPSDNWWNLDVSTAPIDPSSASSLAFIGSTRTMHPDFGGDVSPGSAQVYGFPYAVVDSTGLIIADNGSDLYVSGTYDTRWSNDVLHPAFRALTANDFEVIALGYQAARPASPTKLRIVGH